MKRPASSQQVEISSDDSSSSEAENDVPQSQQPNVKPTLELSSEGTPIFSSTLNFLVTFLEF